MIAVKYKWLRIWKACRDLKYNIFLMENESL